MKFDFVIRNPPYQEQTLGDNKGFAPPVYDKFIDAAQEISERVEMIHPARFLFNAGSTPKEWNKRMLENPHLKVLRYESKSSLIFANTDIMGGIAITYFDRRKDFGAIQKFIAIKELNSVFRKIKSSVDFVGMDSIAVSSYSYHFTDLFHKNNPTAVSQMSVGHSKDLKTNTFERLGEFFYDSDPNDEYEYAKIVGRFGNERVIKYIREDYIAYPQNYRKYKIFIAKANGSRDLGSTGPLLLGDKNTGSTETFMSLGSFEKKSEAENAIKYIKTKFARALFGISKVTQQITPDVWKYVPMQDFTKNSDICWDVSIDNICKQLYQKYDLTAEEISFIETNVKEME